MVQQPALTLVIGGASSGKSSFAEHLVIDAGLPKTYIATAQMFDDEMSSKVAAHKKAREAQNWTTVEEPLDVNKILNAIPSGGIVLLDCATMWLNNLILAERDTSAAFDDLITGLTQCAAPVVVVSNEVGLGIVPENALARRFRVLQGQLNARLAAQAGLVVLVTAGLPLALKGQLPVGPA
ncbi:MAG: bifunctional adenosylcobinamide kinase/adenosylcobinamide-phosphate guanylyltransferase [Pseudomonadota bacterium]